MVWTKDHRVIVDFDVDDDGVTSWDLIIRNVQFDDIGVYECQITSMEFLTRNVELKVFEKPPSKSKSTQLKLTTLRPTVGTKLSSAGHQYLTHTQEVVTAGFPVRLACNTSLGNTSLPTSSLEWFKDGRDIHSSKHNILLTRFQLEVDRMYVSELLIDRATEDDTGEYKCQMGEEELFVFKILVLPKTKNRSRKDKAHFYATSAIDVSRSKDDGGNGKSAESSASCISPTLMLNILVCSCSLVSLWLSSLIIFFLPATTATTATKNHVSSSGRINYSSWT